MNTEQIIKALECCKSFRDLHACDVCPYFRAELGDDESCANRMAQDALALIKSLQGEIRGLNSAIETLQGVAKDYEHRNENLINENKYFRERLAEEMEHAKDMRGT